ncbi:hypothetical protein ABW20_dc0100164 [Dactylellina cionopaga]|nr:hypothetical protein ABW20_dc0100164 [Dactylellina cionopaga]
MLFSRRLSPFRIIVYICLLAFTLIFFSSLSPVPIPVTTPALEKIQSGSKKIFGPAVPSWYGPGAHKTPEPTNGTSSTPSWYEHWSWLNPFASSKDYYESRTVLPPLPRRCPIYAYYDQDIKSSGQTHTDDAVMLAWRRAWWAAGFEPIILNPTDAREHGLYQKVKGQIGKDHDKLEYNILRWLAWDRMGSGILSDFRIFPMPTPSDPVLPFLKRCDYGDTITRFSTLGSALFAGSSPAIKAVVTNITSSDLSTLSDKITSPADIATDLFTVDAKPSSIAYYSSRVVAEKYKELQQGQLPRLINAHLHSHFQTQNPAGIHILNPLDGDSDVLSLEAYRLGQKLIFCPESPIPTSCPPNADGCRPCDENQNLDRSIHLFKDYRNDTEAFTIGGIPHPMTLQGIIYNKLIQEIRFIRQNTTRDVFLKTVTGSLSNDGKGSGYRAVRMKERIAASLSSSEDRESGVVNSIWTTVEKGWDIREVEWILGFTLTDRVISNPMMRQNGTVVETHRNILENARHAVIATSSGLKKFRGAVEGWNLGDFEVWKFVGAFEARRKGERESWLKREKGFGKGIER